MVAYIHAAHEVGRGIMNLHACDFSSVRLSSKQTRNVESTAPRIKQMRRECVSSELKGGKRGEKKKKERTDYRKWKHMQVI